MPAYQNDIFESSVDADLSGGPFITKPEIKSRSRGRPFPLCRRARTELPYLHAADALRTASDQKRIARQATC